MQYPNLPHDYLSEQHNHAPAQQYHAQRHPTTAWHPQEQSYNNPAYTIPSTSGPHVMSFPPSSLAWNQNQQPAATYPAPVTYSALQGVPQHFATCNSEWSGPSIQQINTRTTYSQSLGAIQPPCQLGVQGHSPQSASQFLSDLSFATVSNAPWPGQYHQYQQQPQVVRQYYSPSYASQQPSHSNMGETRNQYYQQSTGYPQTDSIHASTTHHEHSTIGRSRAWPLSVSQQQTFRPPPIPTIQKTISHAPVVYNSIPSRGHNTSMAYEQRLGVGHQPNPRPLFEALNCQDNIVDGARQGKQYMPLPLYRTVPYPRLIPGAGIQTSPQSTPSPNKPAMTTSAPVSSGPMNPETPSEELLPGSSSGYCVRNSLLVRDTNIHPQVGEAEPKGVTAGKSQTAGADSKTTSPLKENIEIKQEPDDSLAIGRLGCTQELKARLKARQEELKNMKAAHTRASQKMTTVKPLSSRSCPPIIKQEPGETSKQPISGAIADRTQPKEPIAAQVIDNGELNVRTSENVPSINFTQENSSRITIESPPAEILQADDVNSKIEKKKIVVYLRPGNIHHVASKAVQSIKTKVSAPNVPHPTISAHKNPTSREISPLTSTRISEHTGLGLEYLESPPEPDQIKDHSAGKVSDRALLALVAETSSGLRKSPHVRNAPSVSTDDSFEDEMADFLAATGHSIQRYREPNNADSVDDDRASYNARAHKSRDPSPDSHLPGVQRQAKPNTRIATIKPRPEFEYTETKDASILEDTAPSSPLEEGEIPNSSPGSYRKLNRYSASMLQPSSSPTAERMPVKRRNFAWSSSPPPRKRSRNELRPSSASTSSIGDSEDSSMHKDSLRCETDEEMKVLLASVEDAQFEARSEASYFTPRRAVGCFAGTMKLPYRCFVCGDKFASDREFAVHLEFRHKIMLSQWVKAWQCFFPGCLKTFCDRPKGLDHAKIHFSV